MSRVSPFLAAFMLVVLGLCRLLAQQSPAQRPPMSFFVTSVGLGNGASLMRPPEGLGGLASADRHCRTLAEAAGAGSRTWRAYLSTDFANSNSGRQTAVNARDRIGEGPWYNTNGVLVGKNVDDLHGEGNNLNKQTALTEKGEVVNGAGDKPNRHDILTGSQPDGRAFPPNTGDHTCRNWTSNSAGAAQLGHHDRTGGGFTSWNSAHLSKGCSQENLAGTGGAGLFYCFAIN